MESILMTTRAIRKTITRTMETTNMLSMRSDCGYVVFINSTVNYADVYKQWARMYEWIEN